MIAGGPLGAAVAPIWEGECPVAPASLSSLAHRLLARTTCDMAGFWSGLWHGALRSVECPYCRRKQAVGRRPMPFEASCRECRRTFRVTETGAKPVSR